MATLQDSVATTVAVITAMGAFGAAASGLVDASKAFWGGMSNFGFGYVEKALAPFDGALNNASLTWRETLHANWINGVVKEDQKTAAKTLIRLGLSSANADALAATARVDPQALRTAMIAIEAGNPVSPAAAQLFGRLNAVIDAAMDAGFERGDQKYRNASKLAAGIVAVVLALWAGALISGSPLSDFITPDPKHPCYIGSTLFWTSLFVGLIAVPIAPVAKDLASSLQAAATAVTAAKQ